MSTLDYREFHRRRLPHIHPPGKTFFITYRLAGSIPKPVLNQYEEERKWLAQQLGEESKPRSPLPEAIKRTTEMQWESFRRQWFVKFEAILDKAVTGPMWLQDQRLTKIIADNLHYHHQKAYQLHAYCLMSNHVHVILTPFLSEAELQEGKDDTGHLLFFSAHPSLSKIMHSLKSYTAKRCNQLLNRQGAFWAEESFDHVIRAGKLEKSIEYVLQNPVKAGLVRDWQSWPWSYKQKCTTGGPPVDLQEQCTTGGPPVDRSENHEN